MKRIYIILAAAAIASCSTDNGNVIDASPVKMTFNVQGDFTLTTSPMTRSLTADGKDMTDLWCLDYVGGTLIQQVHQTRENADFGSPTIDLSMGNHHIYFIASRGQTHTIDTDAHTIVFSKILDTFYKDYEITITGGTSSGSRNVVLDRVVTRLKVTFNDAIPMTSATFNITPALWYYGIDYTNGEPVSAANMQPITVNIPSSSIGKTGEYLSIFGFSSTTEWTTDVSINCKDAGNTVLGSATITSAPFIRNRSSEYSGNLFSSNGTMTLSLNTDWSSSHTGTW